MSLMSLLFWEYWRYIITICEMSQELLMKCRTILLNWDALGELNVGRIGSGKLFKGISEVAVTKCFKLVTTSLEHAEYLQWMIEIESIKRTPWMRTRFWSRNECMLIKKSLRSTRACSHPQQQKCNKQTHQKIDNAPGSIQACSHPLTNKQMQQKKKKGKKASGLTWAYPQSDNNNNNKN